MVRLETAEIDRFGPLTGCHPDCSNDVTVIGGPNESGKTLYLEGLLQLLDPGVTDHMDPDPRVDGPPTGRVVVSDGDERHELGEETVLSDVTPIEPINLHNLFVVRDSDLQLPSGTGYYTRLVERLGDIHTTAIGDIRSKLVDEGRLTKTHLNLANREYDTKEVRNDTQALIREIEDYLETISAEDIQETTRDRLQARRGLETVREQLERQRVAKQVHDLAFAQEQLSIYRETTDAFAELEAFDRDTLTELRELDQEISRDEDERGKLADQIEEKEAELGDRRDRLAETRAELEELQQREGDVEGVEDALEEYRDRQVGGDGQAATLRQRRLVSIAGLAGAVVVGAIGTAAGSTAAIGLAVLLLLIGLGGWYLHRRASTRVTDVEERERALIEAARDAGFDVETPEELAPAIRQYRDELEGARTRRERLAAELEATDDRISQLESELEDVDERLGETRERSVSILDDAGVKDIDGFEEKVEEREEHEDKRSGAESILHREIGETDADIAEAKVEFWEIELDDLEAGIGETDVEASEFDEAELAELEEREEELDEEVDDLEAELAEFRSAVEEFERKTTDRDTGPFVETPPTLQAYTVQGLETLAGDLREVVAAIETNAEISEKAIKILDAIKEDEQQKIATLFDPDGPASSTLSALTDGRYEAVDYDPDSETLEVTNADGQSLTPHQLSRGTQDQLFLAARLSLAQQILGNRSGFLILDDPFIAADPTRLRRGFEVLEDLAAAGWQIVYLTAKGEVRETVADDFGLNVYELETLGS